MLDSKIQKLNSLRKKSARATITSADFSDSLHKLILVHAPGRETLSERGVREFEAAKKNSLVHSAVDLWVEKTRANDGILMAVLREAARERNKSFIIKGRGSSVVEQPIRKPWQDDENKEDS